MPKELSIFLIILAIAVVLGIISFLIYRFMSLKLKDKNDGKPSDEEIASQELKRILEPVEDEKIAKEIEEYDEDNLSDNKPDKKDEKKD